MEGREAVKAYRFAFNATSLGRTPEEAFERLLEALRVDPRAAIHEDVSYAPYDYFTVDSETSSEDVSN